MTTFLVPFKGLRGAKSRWEMEQEERESALLDLLEHNLGTVASVVGGVNTVLVCPQPEWADRFPHLGFFQPTAKSLNGDLEQARRHLLGTTSPGRTAVLLPDLPKLSHSDIEAMLQAAETAQVVLCPDHLGIGTNGLVLSPSDCLEFLFEGESYHRHLNRANELGRSIATLRRTGLANDADRVEDLRRISLL